MLKKHIWIKAFLLNLVIALVAIGPFLIKGDGYFALSYDYAGQGIPFQMFMNDAIKSGKILWNSGIDLGSNFLESFHFYNVGSLFTLLLLIVPTKIIPYMMGPSLILKFAVAGLSAALYMSRHMKKEAVILMCSVLYAFSGFACTSLLFVQYMDIVAFFPFLLFGIEGLIEENKKGVFLVFVAINCACNFQFFLGEVLFLALYVLVKYKEEGKKLLQVLKELLLGVALTGVLTIPAISGLLDQNNNIGIMKANGFFNMETTSWMQFVKSFFFPQELMPASGSVWGADWMTDSLYLPLFGAAFWLAYLWRKKNDWLCKIIGLCVLFAAVPGLNSLFIMGADVVYRRWYYMFVLMLVLATGKVLEDLEEYPVKKGMLCQVIVVIVLTVIIYTVDWDGKGTDLLENEWQFTKQLIMIAAGVVGTIGYLLIHKLRKAYVLFVALFCALNLYSVINSYQSFIDNTGIDFASFLESGVSQSEAVVNYLTEVVAECEENVGPHRYFLSENLLHTYYNLGMTNALPTIGSATSYLSHSIFEFYEKIGVGRWDFTLSGPVGTTSFLGAKYMVMPCGKDDTPDFINSNGQRFKFNENETALPIGFSYDSYILESEFEEVKEEKRIEVMASAMVIPDERENEVKGLLKHASLDEMLINENLLLDASQTRMQMACEGFGYSMKNNRFSASLYVAEESGRYAYFTVPYDRHWKATINGEEVEIMNSTGFMAIPVSQGMNEIVVTYWYTPILYGAVASLFGLAGLIWILIRRERKNEKNTCLVEGISN